MRASRFEELSSEQIERDVRLAVRVEEDRVVARVTRLEPGTCVGRVEVQLCSAKSEPLLADRREASIELDRIDPGQGEVMAVGARGRSGRVAQNRDPPGRAVWIAKRQHQEV